VPPAAAPLLGARPSSPRLPGGITLAPGVVMPGDLLEGVDGVGGMAGRHIACGEGEGAAAPHDVEQPTAAADAAPSSPPSDHDQKLSLFYNVYGNPAGAPGRDESARAARDALALFYATFGPPPGAGRPPSRKAGAGSAAGGPAVVAKAAPAPAPASSRRADPARLTFPSRLLRGVVLARPNRFTMTVRLDDTGEVVLAHCPVTGTLGGLGLAAFDGAGVPCLVSRAGASSAAAAAAMASAAAGAGKQPRNRRRAGAGGEAGATASANSARGYARRTRHTVEAVCLADPASVDAAPRSAATATPWVGINQLAANRYLEHFMRAGALPSLVPDPAGLAREVAVPGGSRLDFVYQGRDLVEVKSPLEALPLLAAAGGGEGGASSSSGGASTTTPRPNPALVAALAARRSARGSLLSRYPVARRAAMYERAARHAAALADHLAAARDRERLAARRAARAVAGSKAGGRGGDGAAASTAATPPPAPPKKARAMLVHCFQFDAPPVRRAIPAPKADAGDGGSGGANAASNDGRAAVLAAMRSAADSGVEVWQVNLRLDPDGVSLGDCFRLDLFADERRAASAAARAAARGRAHRSGAGGRPKRTGQPAPGLPTLSYADEEEEEEASWSEEEGRWQPAAASG